MNIASLNSEFGIAGQLEFVAGPGGLIQARIHNAGGSALVSTYAGQVLSYQPAEKPADMMFLSDSAYFEAGKAIKGGVPVCWPWFGPDPEGRGRAGHGFVRNRQWDVVSTGSLAGGATQIVLGVDASDETRAIWPHEFELRIAVTVGSRLQLELKTTNKGDEAFNLTQGLHTYFAVGDVTQTTVNGLQGKHYTDKMDGDAEKLQAGAVVIDGEVDRIYKDVSADLVIDDAGLARRIRIAGSGSNSAVVWNPWADTAAKMADLGDNDYRNMICVETTNAGDDVVGVGPGETFTISALYSVERD